MAPGAGFPPPSAFEPAPERAPDGHAARSPSPRWCRPVPSRRRASPCVDVETSGLSARRHRVLQVGVVRVLGDGTVIDRWDTLLRAPWRPLGGRDIHGLSRRTLRGAPRLRQVAAQLASSARRADRRAPTTPSSTGRSVPRAPPRRPRPAGRAALCTLRLSRSLDPERAALAPPRRRLPALRRRPHPAPRRGGRRRGHRRAPAPPPRRRRDHRPRAARAAPRRHHDGMAGAAPSAVAGQHPGRGRGAHLAAAPAGPGPPRSVPAAAAAAPASARWRTGSSTTRSSPSASRRCTG